MNSAAILIKNLVISVTQVNLEEVCFFEFCVQGSTKPASPICTFSFILGPPSKILALRLGVVCRL
jgi:hypothetical protein